MDKFSIELNISLNFTTTYLYLELVCNYTSILLLLRRIEDRKHMAMLYHAAVCLMQLETNQESNSTETMYYQQIMDLINLYDNPVRQLITDFSKSGSHQLEKSLLSLYKSDIFYIKCQSKNNSQTNKKGIVPLADRLSLIQTSLNEQQNNIHENANLQMQTNLGGLNTSHLSNGSHDSNSNNSPHKTAGHSGESKFLTNLRIDKNPWLLVSEEQVIRWVFYGYLIKLNSPNPDLTAMFTHIMETNLVITIFRNEVHIIHKYLAALYKQFSENKLFGIHNSKKEDEIKNLKEKALVETNRIHNTRRAYLREILHEQVLTVKQVPGLIAPKLAVLLETILLARHEIKWTVIHRDKAASLIKGSKLAGKGGNGSLNLGTLFLDTKLGELAYNVEELSGSGGIRES